MHILTYCIIFEKAKAEFFLFFFGGSGALGIGGNQIPKILKEYENIKALGGGSTKGGEILECNFLATIGYPEPLRKNDIEEIIQNCPSVDKIIAKGQKKTYIAKLGYVEKEAFDEVMASSNPLARFAVFEAIAGGGASTVASPDEFKLKIASWKESDGLETFKSDLLKAALKRYSAFAVFAFLILLVLDLIIESGSDAFL